MPYTSWPTEELTGASRAPQAFVFDGWSLEPLVIACKPDVQAASDHHNAVVAASSPSTSRAG